MSAQTLLQTQTESPDTGVSLRPWKREEFEQAGALGWFGVEPMELIQGRVLSCRTGREWQWTRERFYKASDLGWFMDERVERIQGEVYRKVTQNAPHFTVIQLVASLLTRILGANYVARAQGPFPLPNDGDPEPDILVAKGAILDYSLRHPDVSEAILVVEVSDTTLHYDKRKKATLYAEAGIADYWITNLTNRTLEVRRDPMLLPEGWGYQNVTIYTTTQTIIPLLLPDVVIPVAGLFPPASQQNP